MRLTGGKVDDRGHAIGRSITMRFLAMQKSNSTPASSETLVRNIRRATTVVGA